MQVLRAGEAYELRGATIAHAGSQSTTATARMMRLIVFIWLFVVAGLTYAYVPRAQEQVIAWAHSPSDSVRIRNTFISIQQPDGSIIMGHSIYSPSQIDTLKLAELLVGPRDPIRVTFDPPADSVRVTPVRNGRYVSDQATPARFLAPDTAGRYDYLASARWSSAPRLDRRAGAWVVRLRVR